MKSLNEFSDESMDLTNETVETKLKNENNSFIIEKEK